MNDCATHFETKTIRFFYCDFIKLLTVVKPKIRYEFLDSDIKCLNSVHFTFNFLIFSVETAPETNSLRLLDS